MKITSERLKSLGACREGVDYAAATRITDAVELLERGIADNKLHWVNWLVARLLDDDDKIRYAVFAAEQVIGIYEQKYPEDKRPRQAIAAAKRVLESNNAQNRDAAKAAADAAYAAATAAKAAANASGDDTYTKILRYGVSLLQENRS